jgi:hypothetical protein
MANGKGAPQCYACNNYSKISNDHRCSLHKFIFPKVSSEIICRDFACEGAFSVKFEQALRNLDQDHLYYSCTGCENFVKFGSFAELQNKVYEIVLLEDEKYRWVFQDEEYSGRNFGTDQLTFIYQNNAVNFEKKRILKEMFVAHSFVTGEVTYKPAIINAYVMSKSSSMIIDDFFNSYLDLSKYFARRAGNKDIDLAGIVCFIKEIANYTYILIPDYQFKKMLNL